MKRRFYIIIQNHLQKEKKRLEECVSELKAAIDKLSDGNLIYSRNGKRTKWYKSNGAHPIYISGKNRPYAAELALKKYYTLLLEENVYELKLINNFLERYRKRTQKSAELIAPSSCYNELLADHFQQQDAKAEQWLTLQHTQSPRHPEHLIHKCISGHKVRSKSEVIIANTLFLNKIPYKYEHELSLSGLILFPDFTICHPETNEIFYWEHFGMMNNSSYRENAFNKLKLYGDHNIIPTINLITTYETAEHPVDSEKIQGIIDEYFL